MNKILRTILVFITGVALFTGCALFSRDATIEQKAADVENLSYAAASIGTQFYLQREGASPEDRAKDRLKFETARNDLQQLIDGGVVTGAGLRNVLASLPVKELKSPQARIAIENATFLYDVTVGDKLNVESNPYVLGATRGVLRGITAGLAAAPLANAPSGAP